MLDLVPRIRDVWRSRRTEVEDSAAHITQVLRQSSGASIAGAPVDESVMTSAFEALEERFDPEHGGFGSAPKFPSPQNLLFLLRYWNRTGNEQALRIVTETLQSMRLGGIFDQLGFGFHRYSTDAQWLVPHFEKMLYDQEPHDQAYTEAHQATGDAGLRRAAQEVIEYVLRDLRSPEEAFYSAEDAGSEGREGKFYLWTVAEVKSILPAELATLVVEAYGLTPEGNFEDEATRMRTGENILHLREMPTERAAELEEARRLLFRAREQRVRPGLDDKILLDWNGLMIAALARAAAAFGSEQYASAARQAADFLLQHLHHEGSLQHRYRNGEAAVPALLDDLAFLIWGLIELYEATFETRYLREALRLQDEQLERFWDDKEGGFYFAADDAEELLVRQKEFFDGAVLSGNAASFSNLLRLARMTGRTTYEERAEALLRAASGALARMPAGFTGMLCGLDFALGPTAEVVI